MDNRLWETSITQFSPEPCPLLGGCAHLALGTGSRPHSVPWPPRLVHTTAQTPRPLWWLSKTWHPSHTQGPLPALILERPIHLKPEHLRGAAPPYSFAWPVFSTQLVLKAAPWLGNLQLMSPASSCSSRCVPRATVPGSLLEKQNIRPHP